MEREFEGQVVAVTGAGSGIGRETARMFAGAGATVVALDIDEARVRELAAGDTGGVLFPMRLDISDEKDTVRAFASIHDRFGRLDVLVNSAGIATFLAMDELTSAMWDTVLAVNLRGTFLCCREAAAIMKPRKSGSIVNISAGAAKTGGVNVSASYVASKGGMNSLTFHFAIHLAPHGIRVNAICPGPIDTPMMDAQAHLSASTSDGKATVIAKVPLGLGRPEDIAHGAMFLASKVKARYITGEILDINGGLVMD